MDLNKKNQILAVCTRTANYLRRESAITLRRSSIEEEEGRIPRSIRHWTPLRLPKGRFSDGTTLDDDGASSFTISSLIFCLQSIPTFSKFSDLKNEAFFFV